LLIAEPNPKVEFPFEKSVILVAEHNKEGSVGFIINKPLKYKLNEIVPEIYASFTIYNGGPIEQNNLYFIHNIPEIIVGSIEISDGIFWGGDYEATKNLINSGVIKKENVRFFLGYSGWHPQQLENEMENNAWIVSENVQKNKILNKSISNLWEKKINEIGGDYEIWACSPEDPSLN
jgi:putative transcriptional regulator